MCPPIHAELPPCHGTCEQARVGRCSFTTVPLSNGAADVQLRSST